MSSDLYDRLQRLRQAGRLQRPGRTAVEQGPQSGPMSPTETGSAAGLKLLDLPGMEEVRTGRGAFLLRTLIYDLSHRQGSVGLRELLALPPGAPLMAGRDPALAEIDFRRMAFVDTETSGLAGGTGTIVFFTGVGTFEDDRYIVRQFFARNPAEEASYLGPLLDLLQQAQGFVSFNGKAFDLPLLRTRLLLAGLEPPDEMIPHLDLLHPARRLWRDRLGACNFGHLETSILGHHRRGEDVPSWLIPTLWFRYARGEGNVGDMAAVLYHNLEDVVSMVPLAQVICGTFAGVVDPHPGDYLSLARGFAGQSMDEEAETAYRQALAHELTHDQQLQALAGLATILKRQGRRAEAAVQWETMVALAPAGPVEPQIELAKYHEWETGDLEAARRWTRAGLDAVSTWRSSYQRRQVLAELRHRLERLERKLGLY